MTDPKNLEKKNGPQGNSYPPRGGENNNKTQEQGNNKGGVQGRSGQYIEKSQRNGIQAITTPPRPTTSGGKENK